MPSQQVNVGTAPDDGTGDQLRNAFIKVNDNTNWIVAKVGAGDSGVVQPADIAGRYLDMTAATNVWEDLRYDIESLNPVGVGSPASLVTNSGQSGTQVALRFTTNNTLYVPVQMSHHWIPGTIIYPHIHIEPQTALANTIVWNLWWSAADPNGTFPADSTTGNFNGDIAAGSQWKHVLIPMPPAGINLAAFAGPSTIVRLKYQVISSSAAFDVISFDVHYRWGGSPVVYTPP